MGDESGVVDIDVDDDCGNSRDSEGTQMRERAEGNVGEEEMDLQRNGADDEEQVQSVPVVVGAMHMGVDVPVEADVGRTRKPSRKLRSRLEDGEAGVENAKSKSKRAPTTKVTLKVKVKPPSRPLPETVSVSGSAAPPASGIPGSRVRERDHDHIESEDLDEDAEMQSSVNDAEEDEDELPSVANTSSGKSKPSKQTKSRAAKPPPETYKQPWSMSEQNLLEGLLERFGDGEKFRYVFPRSFWFWFSVFCVVWYELFLVLFFVLRGVPTSFRLPYPFSLIEVNLDRLMTFR